VEHVAGKKDHAKVKAFVAAVQDAFANLPPVVSEGNGKATGS
jgi:hypothetical protein